MTLSLLPWLPSQQTIQAAGCSPWQRRPAVQWAANWWLVYEMTVWCVWCMRLWACAWARVCLLVSQNSLSPLLYKGKETMQFFKSTGLNMKKYELFMCHCSWRWERLVGFYCGSRLGWNDPLYFWQLMKGQGRSLPFLSPHYILWCVCVLVCRWTMAQSWREAGVRCREQQHFTRVLPSITSSQGPLVLTERRRETRGEFDGTIHQSGVN